MITDIHRHFVPPEFFTFLRSRPEFRVRITREAGQLIDAEIRGIPFGLNTTFFDLQRQIEQLRFDRVDRSVLSLATPFIDYHLDPALAVEASRLFNDTLADAIKEHHNRFLGWAFLPLQVPSEAAIELHRCVDRYGFVGGHVASNVAGTYLNDERFEQVFRVAADLNVPLFIHPADPAGRERMREYELTVVAGYLFDSTINIYKLICSGFMDRWPTLKLVCAHVGGFSLLLRARMQREVDTNAILSKSMKHSVGHCLRQFYFDSICFEPAILQYAVSAVSSDRILLGSDAPFPLGEPDPVGFVEKSLSVEDSANILGKNFEHILSE